MKIDFNLFLWQVFEQDPDHLHGRVLRCQRRLQVLGPVHQLTLAGQDSLQARCLFAWTGNYLSCFN